MRAQLGATFWPDNKPDSERVTNLPISRKSMMPARHPPRIRQANCRRPIPQRQLRNPVLAVLELTRLCKHYPAVYQPGSASRRTRTLRGKRHAEWVRRWQHIRLALGVQVARMPRSVSLASGGSSTHSAERRSRVVRRNRAILTSSEGRFTNPTHRAGAIGRSPTAVLPTGCPSQDARSVAPDRGRSRAHYSGIGHRPGRTLWLSCLSQAHACPMPHGGLPPQARVDHYESGKYRGRRDVTVD